MKINNLARHNNLRPMGALLMSGGDEPPAPIHREHSWSTLGEQGDRFINTREVEPTISVCLQTLTMLYHIRVESGIIPMCMVESITHPSEELMAIMFHVQSATPTAE